MDAIFLGMNSQWARDEAINLMNEEGKGGKRCSSQESVPA